jgi:hypothetical protein
MCGSTPQQTQISDAQQQMYQTLTSNYNTTFGQQQQITGALTAAFQPILQAGPSQTGMSPGQVNALNTENTENVATNYAQAQKATAQILAAQGGGNTLLPSSTNAQLLAANATAAAQARSQGQLAITNQNYQMGYQNWQNAASVLSNTAGLINPLGYAGQSTGAGSAAATTANQIASQQNSIWNAAIGALGSVGGAAIGAYGLPKFGGGAPSIPSIGNTSDINPAFANYNATQALVPPSFSVGPSPMGGGMPAF